MAGRRRIANTTEVGRWNAEIVLECLYDRESRTNAELVRETGLSRSTVERALELLVELGVVTRSEPMALVSGRPAAFYRLCTQFGCLLAIDVGPNVRRVRIDDLAGPEADEARADGASAKEVSEEGETSEPLAAVAALADRAIDGAGVPPEQVRAVTVATPGIVDSDGVVKLCNVIPSPGWQGDGVRAWARERFPRAVVAVDNDANLGVLGEQRFGVAGDAGDVVAVFAGRRIGFGILRGGVLHRGAHDQAGEAANVRGSSWEQASSWLHEHTRRGDLFAPEVASRFVQLLSAAFAEVVHTIDPELIVLGGALSLAGATILDPVAEQFEKACGETEAPELLLSALGRRAVLLGAAEHSRRLAFAHLLDDTRPHASTAAGRRP